MDNIKFLSIDDMPLSVRARNVLRRARIRTMKELLMFLHSQYNLLQMRGCGMAVAQEINEIAKPYLEIYLKNPEEGDPLDIFPQTVVGKRMSEEESAAARSLLIEELRLSVRIINAIHRLNVSNVFDLAIMPTERLTELDGIGKAIFKQIRKSIRKAINEPAHDLKKLYPSINEIRSFVESLLDKLSQKEKEIITDRFGLWDGKEDTYEDIAAKYCVTKQRIHQIAVRVQKKLKDMIGKDKFTAYLLNISNELFKSYFEKNNGVATKGELLEDILSEANCPNDTARLALNFLLEISEIDKEIFVQGLIIGENNIVFQNQESKAIFENTVDKIRTVLLSKGRPCDLEEMKDNLLRVGATECSIGFLRKCAEVSNIIGIDESNKLGLSRWKFFKPQNITTMAQRALMEIGQPVHFMHIIEKMNCLFLDRAPFCISSVRGRMQMENGIFTCLGRGYYALQNWGIKRVPYIKDFLVDAIKRRGGIAQTNELIQEGKVKYGYKEASILMTLGTNPRIFKKNSDGAWNIK